MEIKVSKSPLGNWHLKVTDEPHNSTSFTINSAENKTTRKESLTMNTGREGKDRKEKERTWKGNGTINGENSGVAADVTELAVGGAR